LSKVACRGVLKRAAQYGKALEPPEFRAALETAAGETLEQVRESLPNLGPVGTTP
jgi:Ser/Thr protein kinase RdoA (MazF antagonist)